MADLEKFDVEILATDLNVKSLQKASDGILRRVVFPQHSGMGAEHNIATRWRMIVGHSLSHQKMVSFAQFNLMNDSFLRF